MATSGNTYSTPWGTVVPGGPLIPDIKKYVEWHTQKEWEAYNKEVEFYNERKGTKAGGLLSRPVSPAERVAALNANIKAMESEVLQSVIQTHDAMLQTAVNPGQVAIIQSFRSDFIETYKTAGIHETYTEFMDRWESRANASISASFNSPISFQLNIGYLVGTGGNIAGFSSDDINKVQQIKNIASQIMEALSAGMEERPFPGQGRGFTSSSRGFKSWNHVPRTRGVPGARGYKPYGRAAKAAGRRATIGQIAGRARLARGASGFVRVARVAWRVGRFVR